MLPTILPANCGLFLAVLGAIAILLSQTVGSTSSGFAFPSPEAPRTELPDSCATSYIRRVDVASAQQLAASLAGARPGDLIVMANGIYSGQFVINASGTASDRIWLCGSHQVILAGGSTCKGYGLHLKADYWTLSGFAVTDSQKGIMADGANHNLLHGLAIYNIGDEGVHFRAFSSHNVLEASAIHNVGLRKEHNGEGVYVGSAHTNWCRYTDCQPDRSDFNEIRGNTIGPNTTAESVDIKEGTTGGIISGNTFAGAGMSDADSWVDVKGNGYTITGNVGVESPTDGFQTHVQLEGWGEGNVFRGNVANVDGDGYGFRIDGERALGNVVSCDNRVEDAGEGLANVECTPHHGGDACGALCIRNCLSTSTRWLRTR